MCVCVCETHLKDSVTPSVMVLHFREQFSSLCFESGTNFVPSGIQSVCVCVCETHLKDSVTPSVIVLYFREQFYARWQCAIFSREQFIFPVPGKGISFIPLVFALVLCETVKAHLTASRL